MRYFDYLLNKSAYQRFFTAGVECAGDMNLMRRLRVLLIFLVMTIVMCSFFAIYNIARSNSTIALVDSIGVLVSVIALWYVQKYQRYHFASNLTIIGMFFVFICLAHINQNDSYGLIWTCIFPIYAIMVKGHKAGIRVVLLFYAVLLPMAFAGIGVWQGGAWDFTSFLRFALASATVTASMYFSEMTLEKASAELAKTRERENMLLQEKERLAIKLLEQKDQFLADVSHELRTPLSVLRVQLELLEDGKAKDAALVYQILQRKIDELNDFVADLHQIALSDSGHLKLEDAPINISELLEDLVTSFLPMAKEKQIQIHLEEMSPVYINGDKHRLMQVFANLIKNSLSYTAAGGHVYIHYQSVMLDTVCVHIEDSAPGVSPEFLPKLFDRLFRAEKSRSRKTGGSGLGLSICKSIVQLHKGTISASQSKYGGILISVKLPLQVANSFAEHKNIAATRT